jgi:phenylalanine-4-hydroxylase
LIFTQKNSIQQRACTEYLQGLKDLQLPDSRIPQLAEVSTILKKSTNWTVEPVASLISIDHFFELLAQRKFPCATFIRTPEDLHYLQEPDIFHEVFGHCPMLTNEHFAEFTARYGRLGLNATHKERLMLARLYWFTIEFGLLKENNIWKIYGGGILSSIGETSYCLTSAPEKHPFDIVEILRTPYRIDIMQPLYFYLNSLHDLEELSEIEIMNGVHKAMELGMLPPKYAPKSA